MYFAMHYISLDIEINKMNSLKFVDIHEKHRFLPQRVRVQSPLVNKI